MDPVSAMKGLWTMYKGVSRGLDDVESNKEKCQSVVSVSYL